MDELRETVKKLKETQNQLVRSEKLAGIGQLAAGVAHEINNPTAFILCNMSAVKKYVDRFFSYIDSMEKLVISTENGYSKTPGIQEKIQGIINSKDYRYLKNDLPVTIEDSLIGLHRIKSIVSSLLEFASSSERERSFIDVNVEIESILLKLENEIKKKGRVEKKLGSLTKTYANSDQLKQMFINLIRNAIQAIEANGIITVTTEMNDNYIIIKISDNGEGIPPNDIKNIFNPFFSTREVGDGVGLGLSIAYRIIEGHNGSIDVQSKLGRGTVFTIRLPIISRA